MACTEEPGLNIRVGAQRLHGRTVVMPTGEVNGATSHVLRDCLAQCSGDVVVDLSGVTFLDATGISVLVVQRTRLLTTGGSFELRDPQPIVRKAIEAVGLSAWILD